MAAEPSRILPRIGIWLLLSAGAAVLWGFAAGYVATTHLARKRSASFLIEELKVTPAGEPLIHSAGPGADQLESSYRALNGDVRWQSQPYLKPISIMAKPEKRSSWDGPMRWEDRLIQARDGLTPSIKWFLIRDGGAIGRAYLQAFDETTKSSLGFIGRRGATSDIPAAGEQFVVGGRRSLREGRVAGLGIEPAARLALASRSTVPQSCLYLVDDDRVVEIDLQSRRVRTIVDSPEAVSVAIGQSAVRFEEATGSQGVAEWAARLVVRHADRVAIINPSTNQRVDFVLPEGLRNDALVVYLVNDNEALLDRFNAIGGRQIHDLTWINRNGEIIRQEMADLFGTTKFGERRRAAFVAAVVPVPLLYGAFVSTIMTTINIFENEVPTYADALKQAVRDAWPFSALMLAVSAAAAWQAIHLQRRYGRSHTGLWAVLVFLLGLPGLIAYLVQHRRSPMAPCPACGKAAPRDREACLACGREFPAPRMTGIEVFA